jgi:hypothetical protein
MHLDMTDLAGFQLQFHGHLEARDMHGIRRQGCSHQPMSCAAGAVPQLIAAGQAAGIRFVSVNDFVQEKYGMSPADVVSYVASNCPNAGWNGWGSSSGGSSSSGGNGGGRRSGPGDPGGPGPLGPFS